MALGRSLCASSAITSQIFALNLRSFEASKRLDELHEQQRTAHDEHVRRHEEWVKQQELGRRESDRRFDELLQTLVNSYSTKQHQRGRQLSSSCAAFNSDPFCNDDAAIFGGEEDTLPSSDIDGLHGQHELRSRETDVRLSGKLPLDHLHQTNRLNAKTDPALHSDSLVLEKLQLFM
jgi:hypothetical protein